jgi:selenocysteine-specific elongation factor
VVPVVDVALRTLPDQRFPKRGRVDLHVGAGEQEARVRVLDDEGQFARVWLTRPVPLAPGDRMVLRSSGRQTTIGGAEVLDIEPARHTSDALRRLHMPLGERIMTTRPWITPGELGPLAGVGDVAAFAARLVDDGQAVTCGAWLVAPAALHDLRERTRQALLDAGAAGVDLARVASMCDLDVARLRAALADDERFTVDHDLVRDASKARSDDPAAQALVAALSAEPFAPAAPNELGADPALVRALLRSGALIDLDGVVFTADAIEQARALVTAAVIQRGELSVAEIRDLLGSTRKYVIPIVNYMDAQGITRRRGDARVPGPRARSG